MRGFSAAVLACVVMLAGAVSASGAAAPKKSTFPRKCSELFTLASADSVTGHTFTSIATHYVSVNGHQGLDCFFHDADTPPVTSGKPEDSVFLNHIVELSISQRSKSSDAFFSKMERTFAAEAPGRVAKIPQCQPGFQPTSSLPALPPSQCAVLHPFGPDSVEFDDFGIMVLTPKYAINSLSGLHDPLQEPLVHLALTHLH